MHFKQFFSCLLAVLLFTVAGVIRAVDRAFEDASKAVQEFFKA